MKMRRLFLLLASASGVAYAGVDSIFVGVEGDTVKIWHKNAGDLCGTAFVFDVSSTTDTIVVVEQDTSKHRAKCRCGYFDLVVAVTGLQPGDYFAKVYRQELKINNFPNDTTYFIGSAGFVVTGPGSSSISYSGHQSGCSGEVVNVARQNVMLPEFARLSNHPNPFNSSTTISFFIPEELSHSTVELSLYDERGQRVRQLLKTVLSSGEHAVAWDASNDEGKTVASGVYLYHLIIGGHREFGKMSLVK